MVEAIVVATEIRTNMPTPATISRQSMCVLCVPSRKDEYELCAASRYRKGTLHVDRD